MEPIQFNGDPSPPILALPSPKKTSSSTLGKRLGAIGVIFAGVLFSIALFIGLQKTMQGDLVPLDEPEKVDSGLPVRIIIPAIKVDASLERVGLALDGVMGVPENPSNAAWFELGPLPGEKGSAVIAGHYGWKDGKIAAFDGLDKLRKGDSIYVANDKGEIVSFVVREIRSYDPEANAADVFGSSDGGIHLNLITCQGTWNGALNSYSKRLVVFTDMK